MSAKIKEVSHDSKPVCGIIMPISEIDGCTAEHWSDVLSILQDVIRTASFEPNLVSDADDIGIIQKRIVQNVYGNEVVVCDVSGKNPNVMFELGMRLAFDKPTIIIKDDLTNYSFDTSVIEHLEYPRDLRFTRIVAFKDKLKNKILATYQKAKADPSYSTFLKSFGEYKIAHLESKELSSDAYILESLADLKTELRALRRTPVSSEPDRIRIKEIEYSCVPMHISEYAAANNISNLAGLRKQKAKVLAHLKSIDHVMEEFRDELPSYLKRALAGDNSLKEYMPFRNSGESPNGNPAKDKP